MKISKVKIENILGIEHLEIEKPGSVVLLSGANGTGKTSVLESIKAALGGGHDGTLLRQGCETGEIVLVLSDGVEISKKIGPKKSSSVVRHPEFGKLLKPQEYIKKLVDALSVNPVQFLTADADKRLDALLKSIPMQVTADQLRDVPVIALEGVDLGQHALPVLAKISKAVYDLRTGVNRAAKEKRITADQMTAALPADAPEGNWNDALKRATEEFRDLQKNTQMRLNEIKEDARKAEDVHQKLFQEQKAAIKEEMDIAIQKIRDDSEIAIRRYEVERDHTIAQIGHDREGALKAAESEYQPKHQALSAKVAEARAMADAHTKAEAAREFIASLSEDAHKLETQAMELTGSLESIETLKASLLEKLPIAGLEVRDGDIFVDGIAFDRVNTSKRIRLAIEISKLRAGSLGLVAVDGLEALDPKTFAAFVKEAAKSDLQFILSRVTADESLQITGEVA